MSDEVRWILICIGFPLFILSVLLAGYIWGYWNGYLAAGGYPKVEEGSTQ